MDQNMDNQNPGGDDNLNEPQPPQAPTPFGAEPSQTPTPEPSFQAAPEPAAQATPGATPPPSGESAPNHEVSKEAVQWGTFCHLAGLALLLPCAPFPLGNILGPLIMWLIKKDEFPYVDDQGKEALNFQISMSIYGLACLPLICLAGLGAILAGCVAITDLVFIIIASIAAGKGEAYRYPLNLRLIK